MDWKSFFFGVMSVFVILLLVVSLGFTHVGRVSTLNGNAVSGNSQTGSGNIPEKCQIPAGQDLNSWKEHLGHHAGTQDCLKYFS
jgi:hypothetical protein